MSGGNGDNKHQPGVALVRLSVDKPDLFHGAAMRVSLPADGGGGFGSLADVMMLFSHAQAMLAGWVHFLAFGLFIGAWACRTARAESIRFWLVASCLPLIFLFGPIGLLAFQAIRAAALRRVVA